MNFVASTTNGKSLSKSSLADHLLGQSKTAQQRVAFSKQIYNSNSLIYR
jgi:hypothetical protein